jgi:hypothetical protein
MRGNTDQGICHQWRKEKVTSCSVKENGTGRTDDKKNSRIHAETGIKEIEPNKVKGIWPKTSQ